MTDMDNKDVKSISLGISKGLLGVSGKRQSMSELSAHELIGKAVADVIISSTKQSVAIIRSNNHQKMKGIIHDTFELRSFIFDNISSLEIFRDPETNDEFSRSIADKILMRSGIKDSMSKKSVNGFTCDVTTIGNKVFVGVFDVTVSGSLLTEDLNTVVLIISYIIECLQETETIL